MTRSRLVCPLFAALLMLFGALRAAVGATAPGAPTITTVTPGNGVVVVAFSAPSSDGGSAITGYTVTASPGGATATGTSSPLAVGGLTNDTAYTFTVTATNTSGTGAASTASAAATPRLVTQQAYVKAVNTGAGDNLGHAVAMSGSTLVVGAPNEASNAVGVNGDTLNNSLNGAGAVYVFTRSGTTWTQQAYLKASNTGEQDQFGAAVAIAGETVVVGAPRESSSAAGVNGNQADNGTTNAGAVYVFTRDGTTWTQQAYLKASNPGVDDLFGTAVAIAGDTVVVGAYQEDSNATGVNGTQSDNSASNAGAAYVFTRSGTTWSQQAYLKASNAAAGDRFGQAVAISGETIAIGADGEDSNATGVNGTQSDNSAGSSGAAYLFTRSGTAWTQQAYLKASNTQTDDAFGRAVALAGDLLVVGADGEDSAATGANGNQADNLANGSGAAYVFTRSGTTWTQQAYLKASNPDRDDRFGYAVAVSGEKIIVGAFYEASTASGINGNQADNSVLYTGAAYVFQRSGTAWTQQAYVKASNSTNATFFGTAVTLSGDTAVVGATRENSSAVLVGGNQSDTGASHSGAAYVFLVPTAPPTVTTPTSASVAATTATLGGNLVSGGGAAITERGIVYALTSANTTPRLNGTGVTKVAAAGTATGVFTTAVTDLVGNRAYTFAAYATNSAGTAYSDVGTFTTPAGAPSAPTITSVVGGDGLVVVTFTPPANDNGSPITGYTVSFQNGGASSTVTGTSSPIVVGGLNNTGGYYFFTVAATNALGTGPASANSDAVRPSPTAPQAYLKAGNTGAGDQFGAALALSGDTLVVGAPEEDSAATGVNGDSADNTAAASGAVYVFTRSGTTWTQQAYLKASNTGAGDKFGAAVAVAGDTLVVGAPDEASAATGIGGDAADNTAAGAGAAYVFTRSGTTWTQQAYLKAANTRAGAQFGATVAVAGDTVVVGAARETSAATGINGDAADTTAADAGAAYVFTRSGTTWTQQAYLKASNAQAGDRFAAAVALAGETLVVGATGEASAATGVDGNQADNTVAASGAAYIFTRTGTAWAQQAYLKASNTGTNDLFGAAVTISGDTVVVGASGEAGNADGVNGNQADNTVANAGAAYVFTRSGTTWTQQAYLKADNSDAGDRFGWSVALADDSIVVGAWGEASRGNGVNSVNANNNTASGAAYRFQRAGTTWTQQAYIKATNTGDSDNFGRAVAASGLTLAVGAINEDSAATGVGGNQSDNTTANAGAVYAYTFFYGPTVSAPVSPTIAATTATLGGTVASDGALRERGVVYARTATNAAPQIGGTGVTKVVATGTAVGDFTAAVTGLTASTGYTFAAYATNSAGTAYSDVGTFTTTADVPSAPTAVVAVSGNGFAVVQFSAPASNGGAAITGYTVTASPGGATGTGTGSPIVVGGLTNGTAYTFTVTATNSTGTGAASGASAAATPALDNQQAYLKASNTAFGNVFGFALAVSGDTLVVGSQGEDTTASNSGAVYVFTRSNAAWKQEAFLKAASVGSGDLFGASVAISGDTLVVGAYGENGSGADSGAAYIFTRSGTTWTQQALLKASNPGANDFFGYAVGISGDTVIVGAPQEGSSATGVDGAQANESAPYAGAAYVFTRSGTTWTQQAYLKASNTGEYDQFGYAVALSGDTAVVGAWRDDSPGSGVNGEQTSNSLSDAGSAYIFVRSGTAWSQQAYLKASSPGAEDYFGKTVSISGDTVVIGAHQEDSAATGANGNAADNSRINAGAAYVFTRSGATWSQQAYLKASNSGPSDNFGASVSVAGDVVAIGAWGEASGFGGFSGNQTDDSAPSAGATYVWTRSGTTWTQRAYLKASAARGGDQFGSAVAVSAGGTVVASSPLEPSNATGINGNPFNASAQNSGAAFVFLLPLAPSVVAPTATGVAPSTATLGGELTADNGAAVTERGIVYAPTATNAAPRLGGTGVVKVAATGTATGAFTVDVTGLAAVTGYSYSAYATNAVGTGYSPAATFTTGAANPTVASVSVPAAGTRKLGDTLDFTVNWSAAVNVVTTGGTPALGLTVGSAARTATYVSGSGTTATVFRYTVQAGDTDTDGLAVGTLALNGGTIKDTSANDAVLTLAAVGSTAALNVDGTVPTLSAVTLVSGNANPARARTGDVVTLAFTASETVATPVVTLAGRTVTPTAAGNTWTAATTMVAGDAEGAVAFSIAVTDLAGNSGTAVTATSNASAVVFDKTAPAVTAARLALTGATGTAGAFKAGDTVTASWNNTAAGDNNADVASVSVTFSAFGGSTVAATNNAGTWSATFALAAGTLDATNRNVSLTVRDTTGNTTLFTAATNNAVVDTQAPVVTAAKLSLTGATGTGGVFKTGDTVTATWDNTAAGDNNADIARVAVNFGAFGGGSAVAATNSAGSWTATYRIAAGSIEASNLNVSFTATDDAGNAATTTGTANATVDNLAPAAPAAPDLADASDSGASATDNITRITAPVFTGTAAAGTVVTLYATDGTTVLGTATATGGAWSITSAALAAGAHTLTAKAADSAGNLSAASPALTVTVDATAPAAPVITGLADDTGTSATDGVTKDTTLVVNGTAEAAATVTVSKGGNVIGTTTATGTGAWSFDYTATVLGAGEHSFTATATDVAGNTGALSNTFVATIDTTVATPVVTAITTDTGASATDGITRDATLVFTGTADANTTVTVLRNGVGAIGTAAADGSGAWSFDYTGTPLADGTYLFTATATDLAGNTSAASADFPVTVDTAAPVVASTALDVGTYGTPYSFTVAATGAATSWSATGLPAGLTLGAATGTIAGTPAVAGSFTVVVTATDPAGNAGTGTFTLTLNSVTLTVSGLAATSRVYDATKVAALTGTPALVGVLPADAALVSLAGTPAGEFSAKNPGDEKKVGTGKPVVIRGLSLAGTAATNYVLSAPTATADVTAKPLTVTGLVANHKVYDGSAAATLNLSAAALVGVVSGDTVRLVTSAAVGTFPAAGVGSSLAVTVTGLALDGADSGNYQLTPPRPIADITPANVAVTFGNLSHVYDGTPKAATVSLSPAVAHSLSYSVQNPTAAGSYTVLVTVTAPNYTGSANAALVIAKAAQTVAFPAPAGAPGLAAPFALAATASTGLPVTFAVASGPATVSGSALTFTAPGTVVVRATQAGNGNYEPASAERTFSVAGKLAQTIAFAPLVNRQTGDAPFALAATASSGLPVSFAVARGPASIAGNVLTLTGAAGAVVVRASQPGNAVYLAAPDLVQEFNVIGRTQHQVFFGLTQNNDTVAVDLAPDGKSGTLLCFIGATGEAFVVAFTLNADGTFDAVVTPLDTGAPLAAAGIDGRPVARAGVPRTFRGRLSAGAITGSIVELGLSFNAAVQPRTGATAALAGIYVAPTLNSAAGSTTTIVGTQGQVLVLSSGTGVAGGTGTITADGTFRVDAGGATIAGTVDAATTTVAGTITTAGRAPVVFNGLANTVARTDRLANLSARARVAAERTLITGFVVGGTGAQRVLLRAVGPALAGFGVGGALANPRLQLFDGAGRLVLENDDWSGADLAATAAEVGAFALAPGARDAALVAALAPGAYTVHIVGTGAEAGVGLAEIYDAGAAAATAAPRLVNLSTRGTVEAGDGVLIGGFVVAGNAPKKMLVRGVGPALAGFGVGGTLADPRLAIYRATTLVAQNDDWGAPQAVGTAQTAATAAELADAAAAAGAFALATGGRDAAILVTLAPGAYTAQVTGATPAQTGAALVEIYELP